MYTNDISSLNIEFVELQVYNVGTIGRRNGDAGVDDQQICTDNLACQLVTGEQPASIDVTPLDAAASYIVRVHVISLDHRSSLMLLKQSRTQQDAYYPHERSSVINVRISSVAAARHKES